MQYCEHCGVCIETATMIPRYIVFVCLLSVSLRLSRVKPGSVRPEKLKKLASPGRETQKVASPGESL